MPSMKVTIDKHNKKIINKHIPKPEDKPCNCGNKLDCPLAGKCRTTNIVYQATVKTDSGEETYVGISCTEFKQRRANHKQSFKKEKYRTHTELSKYIWTLKNNRTIFSLSWKLLCRAQTYSNSTKNAIYVQWKNSSYYASPT